MLPSSSKLRLLSAVLLCVPLSPVLRAADDAAPLSFNRDLRPILSDRCFACHGFDPKKREAKLRLDTPEGAFAKNEDGDAAIVPGNPEASLVWQRIVTTDKDDVMPPPESHKDLKPAEKELIRKWILQGAPYQKHWAFEAPLKPATPEGGIDGFIAAGLTAHPALAPAPEASRETLIRRVAFTLTGLPPSLTELDAYLKDGAPEAYENMVDRYLASPRYGEEMARHWLDVARYSDTHGMHLDNERAMWAYRDWVVRSFNSNQPFDRFTIEQLAGDLIPDATQDQLIATGFNRCNVTSGEGGAIEAEYLFRYAVDRASTTAQTWLGLTAGCAVCHDHKYDPVTQKEFYQLYAFFYSNADPALDGNAMDTKPSLKLKPDDYQARMESFEKRADGLRQGMEAKAAALAYDDPATRAVKPGPQPVESVWFEDGFPPDAKVNEGGKPPRLVEAPDPVFSGKRSLKRGGAGTTQDVFLGGAAPLTVPLEAKFQVQVYLDAAKPPREVMIQFHTRSWEHRAYWGADEIAFGQAGTPGRVAAGALPETGKWVKLEVDAEKLGLAAGDQVMGYAFTVNGGTAWFDHLAVSGRMEPSEDPAQSFLAWRREPASVRTPGLPAKLSAVLAAGIGKPAAEEDLAHLRRFYLQRVCVTTSPVFAEEITKLEAVRNERKAYEEALPTTLIWNDLAKPRDTFVMERGQYNKPGAPVEPGVPAVLPALHKSSAQGRATRMDLAQWLISPENPLTARVTVNRFWQQVFGAGLVKTSHDFGTQGALPSNPALMDWLAVEFEQNGWDVKKLMRRMLVSQVFRRAAAAPENQWAGDPDNTWLARGPRLRLEAEQLRDQALFVSGLLDFTAGGRGTQPYQPPNIWEPVGYLRSNTRNYKQDTGAGLHRRSLYTFLKRTAPPPFMANFDGPSRELTCTARERSNTPLQALQLMNDIQHVEAARAFAGRILASTPVGAPDADAAAERLKFAWRAALSRPPVPEETAAVLEFYRGNLAVYQAAPDEAKKLIALGDSKADPKWDPVELAAWTLTANMILNLDETINRN
ncbi:MAG: PSD1 and planctomycete cytochrome C domain-containing protein [Verrucomicrobiota bacterium]